MVDIPATIAVAAALLPALTASWFAWKFSRRSGRVYAPLNQLELGLGSK